MIPYDYDVVIVGAGPAGLSAATRLRWLKGYRPIPASVCLVDPEPPGGLAAMGGCILTGPGWALNAEGILSRLVGDVQKLAVPQVRARATSVERAGGMWQVHLSNGNSLRCHAVILATGFRALHGEAAYFGRGLHITYKGYAFFPELIRIAAEDSDGQGLVIIGHQASLDLIPLMAPYIRLAGGATFLLQPGAHRNGSLSDGITIRYGFTKGYQGDGRLNGVLFSESAEGDEKGGGDATQLISCGAALVDYHAFERRPELWEAGRGPLPRREDGFVGVNAAMATSEPGLFAAGDVTGRYASTAMAVGDGVCAGFSAYSYVHKRKFGVEPHLFAYAATGPGPAVFQDPQRLERPFDLPPDALLIPLGPEQRRADPSAPALLAEALDASTPWSVAAFRAGLGDAAAADRAIFRSLFARRMTLHSTSHTPVSKS